MDLMQLITGGASPLIQDESIAARSDPSSAAPPMNPNLDALLRAIAMQKMRVEPPQQGWPEAAASAGFPGGADPQTMPPVAAMPTVPPQAATRGMTGVPVDDSGLPPPARMPVLDENGMDAFSSRNATPGGVPLPRSRPTDGADLPENAAPAMGFNLPITGMPQQSMQDMLPTRGDRTLRNALSAFGAGIAKIPGNSKGAAIGRGFGGAVAGGDAAETADFDKGVKALEQIRRSMAEGDQAGYKSALAQYYLAYADKMRKEMNAPPGTGPTKSSAQERMRDWTIERFKAENDGREPTLEQLNTLLRNPGLQQRFQQQMELEDVRQAGANARAQSRTDSQNFTRNPPSVSERFQQNRGMVTGRKPGDQPAAPAAPAEKPGEISMQGNGSQASPYRPSTQAEYDEMPSGTYYTTPDGTLKRKK